MAALPELLELVNSAAGRRPPLRATVRTWRDLSLQSEAAEDHLHQLGLDPSVSGTVMCSSPRLEGEFCHTERLSLGKNGAFRVDPDEPDFLFRRATVSDGESTWLATRPGKYEKRPASGLTSEAATLFLPSWLAGYYWGEPAPTVGAGGREAWRLHATTGPLGGLAGHVAAPEDVVVSTDAGLGFLHRVEWLFRGGPYSVIELLDIELDAQFGEGTFRVDKKSVVFDLQGWHRRLDRPAFPVRAYRAAERTYRSVRRQRDWGPPG